MVNEPWGTDVFFSLSARGRCFTSSGHRVPLLKRLIRGGRPAVPHLHAPVTRTDTRAQHSTVTGARSFCIPWSVLFLRIRRRSALLSLPTRLETAAIVTAARAWMHHVFVCVPGSVFRRHRSVQQHQFPGTDQTSSLHLQRRYSSHQSDRRSAQTPQSSSQGQTAAETYQFTKIYFIDVYLLTALIYVFNKVSNKLIAYLK